MKLTFEVTAERPFRESLGHSMGILAVVAIVYVLSVGPAVRLADKHPQFESAVETFYAPVGWLYQETALEGLIERYLDLWVDD